MSATRPTWVVDCAVAGVPQVAHCETCGATWRRPQDDRYADTLPDTARAHRCEVK